MFLMNLPRRIHRQKLVKVAAIGILSLVFMGTAYAQTRIKADEVAKHNNPDDLWVAINGQVYDLTTYKNKHPGGAKIIEKYAGTDASEIFNKYHARDLPDRILNSNEKLGELEGVLPKLDTKSAKEIEARKKLEENKPPLSHLVSPNDFEYVAKKLLEPEAWSYYSSAAEDQVSFRENHDAFKRIFFKPRVCRDVSHIDMSTTMLGEPVAAPFFCAAAAQAKMGNPVGEVGIARGCGLTHIPQMISNYASVPLKDIVNQVPGQLQWFQLYTQPDMAENYKTIDTAVNLGLKAIFITVDSPQLGRREKDLKFKAEKGLADGGVLSKINYGSTHPATWDLINQWKDYSKVPVVLKGVGCVEDIILAAEQGVEAVVISNHGGRQLDFARSPIEILADAMPELKSRGLDTKIEVYIDGGVRRGSDILKAVALGARGVGLGRLFLYANSAYGEEGVARLCDMLMEEIRMNMQLLGVTKLSELGPEYLDLRNLHARNAEIDTGFYENYEPVGPPKFLDQLKKK